MSKGKRSRGKRAVPVSGGKRVGKRHNDRHVTKALEKIQNLLYPEQVAWRPTTREDCARVSRPCPYVGCRYNTFLESSRAGTILYTHSEKDPWEILPDNSCALDMAERGGMTLEEIGEVFNITRERVRQIEEQALATLARHPETPELPDNPEPYTAPEPPEIPK